MRVVVSGATSMIGAACVKSCIAHGAEVLAIVRSGTKKLDRLPKSNQIIVSFADLDNLSSVKGDGNPYDVFYHFAWSHTSKPERDNPLSQEENIRATLQAVELAHKLRCKKFIGAGSQAEYGIADGVISSDTKPNPIVAYGMAKLSANMLSRKLCEQYGMEHIWARIFSVYGIYDHEETLIHYAIDCFQKGIPAKFSAATQLWNYLYEEDAGEMFCLLGKKNVASGNYCIANTESKPLREYILQLQAIYGKDAQCEFASPSQAQNLVSLNVDTQKTIAAIGYTPQISFMEGIQRILLNRRTEGGDCTI